MGHFMRFARKATPNKIKNARLSQIAWHLFKPHDQTYDRNYYAEVDVYAVDSAHAMAKTITERFQPKTVIDVGCGTGALLEAFRGLGCEVRGLEYSEAALAYCHRRKLSVRKFNLEKDSADEPRYDLATSFEVAEHLAPWVAKRYVGLLCALSPLVVMSAAPPGQGGRNHINEQPQSYWIKKFKRCNYLFDEKSSRELSLDWRTLGVTSWYRDNVMVFARS